MGGRTESPGGSGRKHRPRGGSEAASTVKVRTFQQGYYSEPKDEVYTERQLVPFFGSTSADVPPEEVKVLDEDLSLEDLDDRAIEFSPRKPQHHGSFTFGSVPGLIPAALVSSYAEVSAGKAARSVSVSAASSTKSTPGASSRGRKSRKRGGMASRSKEDDEERRRIDRVTKKEHDSPYAGPLFLQAPEPADIPLPKFLATIIKRIESAAETSASAAASAATSLTSTPVSVRHGSRSYSLSLASASMEGLPPMPVPTAIASSSGVITPKAIRHASVSGPPSGPTPGRTPPKIATPDPSGFKQVAESPASVSYSTPTVVRYPFSDGSGSRGSRSASVLVTPDQLITPRKLSTIIEPLSPAKTAIETPVFTTPSTIATPDPRTTYSTPISIKPETLFASFSTATTPSAPVSSGSRTGRTQSFVLPSSLLQSSSAPASAARPTKESPEVDRSRASTRAEEVALSEELKRLLKIGPAAGGPPRG